jgi:hypothetical protein
MPFCNIKIYLPLLSYRKTNFEEDKFQDRQAIQYPDKTAAERAADQAEADKINKVRENE